MKIAVGILAIAVAMTGAVSVEAGGDSFAKNCAKCHGDDGKGGKMVKKDVTGSLSGKSEADALAAVKAVKMHSSLNSLSDDDITAAIAGMGGGDDKAVFVDNCAKCHGASAKGGKVAKKDITAAVDGKSADEVVEMMGAVKMHSAIKGVSDADRKIAAGYVLAGATFGKKCASCHGDDARGGKMVKKDVTGSASVDGIKGVKTHAAAKEMSDDELAALVRYIKGQAK